MVIVDATSCVDVDRIANVLADGGVSRPMHASSFIAEEVCRFYIYDVCRLRGDGFIIKPEPRRRLAFYRAHQAGMLDSDKHWAYLSARVDGEKTFKMDELDAVLRHYNLRDIAFDATPADAKPSGLIKLVARG
tara:strand:+ start:518 stop:916 length:399 start_codon:yes stop_codon:yes gene_type:complete